MTRSEATKGCSSDALVVPPLSCGAFVSPSCAKADAQANRRASVAASRRIMAETPDFAERSVRALERREIRASAGFPKADRCALGAHPVRSTEIEFLELPNPNR